MSYIQCGDARWLAEPIAFEQAQACPHKPYVPGNTPVPFPAISAYVMPLPFMPRQGTVSHSKPRKVRSASHTHIAPAIHPRIRLNQRRSSILVLVIIDAHPRCARIVTTEQSCSTGLCHCSPQKQSRNARSRRCSANGEACR